MTNTHRTDAEPPLPARTPGAPTPGGRIVRVAEPHNDEFDFANLAGLITPTEQFYIRSHGPVPRAIDTWRLVVDGLVTRPLSLLLAELRAMTQQQRVVTLECAGNRRTFQQPVPGGVPWGDGAISTASFAGVSLASLLAQAGVQAGARHVCLYGADLCSTDGGPTRFARSVPLDAVAAHDALLALTMNDAPLTDEHGAPLRALLPDLYGMNSIKWLERVTLQAEPHDGYFQVNDYRLWYAADGPGAEIGPVRVMATIGVPRPGSDLPAGETRIHGAAWTGTGTVERVQVSTDNGDTWHDARFTSDATPSVWRLWELPWHATPGEHTLIARATDSEGHTQPDTLPPNRKGYANNFILRVPVRVIGEAG